MLRLRITFLHNAVEQAVKRRPISVDIDNDNGLIVQPQLLPGHNLKHFVQRAEPTRQNNETV